MLKLEYLKLYVEKNNTQLYKLKDEQGQFYALISTTITAWLKGINKGFTTVLPPDVQDVSLELAQKFVKFESFRSGKVENEPYLQYLSDWAVQEVQAYFQKRMGAMGATPENVLTTFKSVVDGAEVLEKKPVFTCDNHTGDIQIWVTRLDGSPILYNAPSKKEGETVEKEYAITRYVKPKGDMKYGIPSNAGVYPFFPESIKEAYIQGLHIPTLFITEGAFKAFKASMEGIPTVALSSYTHYRETTSTKTKPRLHREIVDLIERCTVANVVICWDGDCRNISTKALELEEDISKRPQDFYNAAKTVKDLVLKAEFKHQLKIWYSTIRSAAITGNPKGLDDVLMCGIGTDRVVKAALALDSREETIFYFNHITNSTESLLQWFGLNSVENFRSTNFEVIENKEFVFKKNRYKYNEAKDEVVLLVPEFLRDLRWIGDNYFELKEVPIPSKESEGKLKTAKTLKQVQKSTLSELYGKDFMKFMRNRHYTGFCNMPSHTEYQHEVETSNGRYFNKYFPFEHEPRKGDCSTILAFVEHIFGKQVQMGLDYIQLLLTSPTQKLPVLCLYSKENATGKSKFGELIAQIFKNNVIFINNDDLKSEFGLDRFADKLVAVCEETLLERKKDVERIKFISTAEEPLTINPKGMSAYQLHTYVKLMFFSNNLRMIHATENDERFWIITVPKPKNPDSDLIDKMNLEIPSFIHFLQNRTLSTPKKSRMWFHPNLLRTETLEQVVRVNEHADVQELRNKIEDYFIDFPTENHLMLCTKDIIEEFLNGKSRAWVDEICTRLALEKYSEGGKTVVKRSYLMKKEQSFAGAKDEYLDKRIAKAPARVWVFERSKFVVEDLVYEDDSTDLTQEVINKINDSVQIPF